MASKPLLIIVNGLPGAGKTTLARRLSADLRLPVFARDGLYETLHDALEPDANGLPQSIGSASFALLYYVTGSVLAAGQSLIVEGFFGRPEVRRAEFLRLQSAHDFEPVEILCKADGKVLRERFLARIASGERHGGHLDREWLETNEARLLAGTLAPLAIGPQVFELDTTSPQTLDLHYEDVLRQMRAALS